MARITQKNDSSIGVVLLKGDGWTYAVPGSTTVDALDPDSAGDRILGPVAAASLAVGRRCIHLGTVHRVVQVRAC